MTRERAVLFGPDRTLVGVATLGDNPRHERLLPPIIMLNAGLLPRIGPHRMHVELARRLAADGVTSLRMDFSGIGDSGPRLDGLPYTESVVSEGLDAMDVVARMTHREEFVLMGLCSGADNGFRIACADRRVVGLVLIDAFPYPTPGYYLRHYARRLRSSQSWKNILTLQHPIWGRLRRRSPGERHEEPPPLRELPPRQVVRRGLQDLVKRGVDLLVIYTTGPGSEYNHRNQFLRAFREVDFGDKLQLEYFENTDHTFTLIEDRKRLVELVADWIPRTV